MKKKDSFFSPGMICGSTSLGERGQIVIPKEARERLKLKTGERFLVVVHVGKIILVPEDQMRHVVDAITKHLNVKK